jgi:threonine dehydrogenase-like Zn-dependent dehydrogenase
MDVAIEMSGSGESMQAAIRATHFGGTVVAAAAPTTYDVDLGGDAHFNCLNFIFSRGCSEPNRDHPRWDMARLYDVSWSLIRAGVVSGTRIVNQIVEFDSLTETYDSILDESHVIKMGVRMSATSAGD